MKRLPLISVCLSVIFAVFLYFNKAAIAADTLSLKIATWNLENLREETNKDFRFLQNYAEKLDADVIALQEVDGEAAAKKILSDEDYNFFFSRRNNPQRTGFAVRKGISVIQNPDYEELDVGGVRYGTDITVKMADRAIEMLSVHLKSGCFEKSLTGDNIRGGCIKLQQQVPVLENWIDAEARAKNPFVVLGDFNRRFNQINDDFWQEIDDGVPTNADLIKVTEGKTSTCFNGQYPQYIDHIVLDKQTSQWLNQSSFEELNYNQPFSRQDRLSDHCAIAVSLEIPTPESSPKPSPVEPTKKDLLKRVRNAIKQLQEIESILENG